MNKQRATALGCTSGFVLLCGVAMSVIIYLIEVTALDGIRESDSSEDAVWQNMEQSPAPAWLLGLVFVIPGVMGVIAALVQNKCLYVLNCIISLIALLIMGLLFFFIGMALIVFIFAIGLVKEHCIDDVGACRCRTEDGGFTTTAFETCDVLTTMTGLCIGLFASTMIAWIFLLAVFVLSCVYACRSQASSGTTVYVPAQQPMLPSDQQYPPQYQK